MSEVSNDARADLHKSLQELDKKKGAARSSLHELESSADAKWNAATQRMNQALDELQRSYRKALSQLP